MTPPADETLSRWGATSAILLCIIFGANGVAIKISQAGLGTFTTAGLRFTIASIAIALWAKSTGRPFRVSKKEYGPLLLLCALFSLQISLFYLGLSKTLASRGALVVNVVPFFVLLLAHFFIPGDRITVRKVLGLGLGFSGVAMVLLENGISGLGRYSGDWIILLTAIIWAANAVYTKTVIHRIRPFQLVLYSMMCAAPLNFLQGWLWDDRMFHHLNGPVVAALIYQSLITAAVGFVLWNSLLRRYGASTLHSFIFIMPIAGVTAGGWLLNEPITGKLAAAVGLVAAGIAIVNIKPPQAPPSLPEGRSY